MGKIVSGNFNGTGAALYLGIGFVPDFVRIFNQEDGSLAQLVWSRGCRSKEQEEGRLLYNDTAPNSLLLVLAHGAGVAPYLGGDKMTAASTAYLVKDELDYKSNPKDGGTGVISRWTLDTSDDRTGHFNQGVDTTYVGEGSLVVIREGVGNGKIYEARVTAMTADGDATDNLELSLAIGSGDVLAVKGMYDYRGAASGVVIPAGFVINATSVINVSGEICYFEAGTYDN